MMSIQKGDCVKIPDGRIGRVRDIVEDEYKIRVRRKTSQTHQFLKFKSADLTVIQCPKGWMRPEAYNRYLEITLAKMKIRNSKKS